MRGSDRGLILRRFPYGESSLVLHVLTRDHGRLALLAKGAYRTSSAYFACFDLFDTLALRFAAPRAEGLALVSGAEILVRRPAIARDLACYRGASSALELAHASAREGLAEPRLFAWLEETLDLFAAGLAPDLVGIRSDLALLAVTGLEPALGHCASCGARATDAREVPFSPAAGGRLCSACAASWRARGQALEFLPAAVLRVAQSLRSATPASLARTQLEPRLAARVRAFVGRFLEYHLETRLLSRRAPSPVPHGSA